MQTVIALLLTCVLTMVGGATRPLQADECITGFSVVTSELVVPGKTTAVFLTLTNRSDAAVNVTVRLFGADNVKLIDIDDVITGGRGIVTFRVPNEASGTCALHTHIECATLPHCELKSVADVRVVGRVREVIVRPAKHAYRPEETVTFWTLAIDHDLQIASGTVGTVAVLDPQGTKVAVWDQVGFDDVQAYSMPLGACALTGRWTIAAAVEQQQRFVATFDVTPNQGGVAALDVSVAEEHYVELKFGNEMRRRYKPGLPFFGKVEAMSTEKSVRVRVKVYDNTTSIYSQDIEISNGVGTFLVPAILADSDVIHLQAELVSVESKEIESHYVLAREPIRKWNSTSDCYLLIEGVSHTLQPNEEAHVTVLSTCPCQNDVHYVITTDGRVTDWSDAQLTPSAPPLHQSICKMNFTFMVQAIMAPISQLLVYHVTAQGEPVTDVISFDVRLFDKEVLVNIEARDWWLPGQSVDLEIIAEPASLVCLLGGRAETTGNARFDPTVSEQSIASSLTNQVDFLEAGVSYFQRGCTRRGNTGASAILYRQSGTGAGPAGLKRRPPESLVGGTAYDQLWMWRCFNYSSATSTTELSITAPELAGKWSAWALTVSRTGLRFSAPVTLDVFRPLTVDFRLPRSLKVGESVEADIKIGNSVNACVDVTALLALSAGARFHSNRLQYVTERLRLGPHGATSLVVQITATNQGSTNFTVEVNGYASSTCEGLESAGVNASLSGAVVRSAILKVRPEGVRTRRTDTSYFCVNERLVVSHGDYEWMAAPKQRHALVVDVRTTQTKSLGPIRVVLAENKSKLDKSYTITVGDADNSVSYVSRGKHHFAIRLATNHTPGILDGDTWTTLWITWSARALSLGKGAQPPDNALLRWPTERQIEVTQIGFAAAWGESAQFRVWNYSDATGYSAVMHLDVPDRSVPGTVPGTERGELIVRSGLDLPLTLLEEAGGLYGTVATLVPFLFPPPPSISSDSLSGKIQTILTYRKRDGSFSEHPMFGSQRVTLTVLDVLSRVQAYVSIDPDLIGSIKRWVQLRQEDDGRFAPSSADLPLRYPGSERGAASANTSDILEIVAEITAETVIALYEIGIETDADSDTIEKAKIFLENSLPHVELPETMAAVTLALVLVRSATAAWAVEKLRNASTTEDGEFGWSETRSNAAERLYEARSDETSSPSTAGAADEFRASLHAVATFCLIGDLKTAQSAVRYVVSTAQLLDSRYELFYPTAKVFQLYNSMQNERNRLVTVSLATSGMELTETVTLGGEKRAAVLRPPTLPTKVFVYGTGAGCATLQGKTEFSSYAVRERTPWIDIWAEVMEEISADRSSLEEIEGKLPTLKIRACLRWKGDGRSPIIRMEHDLFSGYELSAPPPLTEGGQDKMAAMLHGHHGNRVWFVLANVTSRCAVCVRFNARSAHVVTALRPAYARAYPAHRPDLMAATFYHARDSRSPLLRAVIGADLVTWLGRGGRRLVDACALVNVTTSRHSQRVNTAKLSTAVTVDRRSSSSSSNHVTDYVVVNKESLWHLIKEAVRDDVKRKELSDMLRETDDQLSN